MVETASGHGLGWLPDYPDFRDFTIEHDDLTPKQRSLGQTESVRRMLAKAGVAGAQRKKLPASVDLRKWCSPIEDQGQLGSCTANAAVGILEYFERRAFDKHIDASRIFIYKTTRKLMHATGDTGAFLRTTMGSLVLFGAPPEEYWPYTEEGFDKEPPAFCYAFAQSFQAISYYRLDPAGTSHEMLLERIKRNLAARLPAMFGFTVYSSISQADRTGKIPFPTRGDKIVGGHAVCAVGYDDAMKIENETAPKKARTGALLIRNSWGAGWGEKGYGWLPYDYALEGLADDWWSLVKSEWIDTGQFKA